MARPRSEDKRKSLLAAAVEVFAEQGPAAPTARIAKVAGVAEGSLFTYFASKDELFNQLYLELKQELHEVMLGSYPRAASVRERTEHIWQTYVNWGVAAPHKRKVLNQLMVSERICAQTRAAGSAGFDDFNALLDDGREQKLLRAQPPNFIGAILAGLAEATIECMLRAPDQAADYRQAGFAAFWNAIVIH